MVHIDNLLMIRQKKRSTSALLLCQEIYYYCDSLHACMDYFRYTPALRPLRQMALTLTFPQQCPTKLAARLQEVCKSQQGERKKSSYLILFIMCLLIKPDGVYFSGLISRKWFEYLYLSPVHLTLICECPYTSSSLGNILTMKCSYTSLCP